jgi:hypothetical protein
MKGAFPIKAQAVGGRHYRETKEGRWVDQNFDAYAVEYTFADGTKMFFDGRCMPDCHIEYRSYAHGTKGAAIVSSNADCGLPSRKVRRAKIPATFRWRCKPIHSTAR